MATNVLKKIKATYPDGHSVYIDLVDKGLDVISTSSNKEGTEIQIDFKLDEPPAEEMGVFISKIENEKPTKIELVEVEDGDSERFSSISIKDNPRDNISCHKYMTSDNVYHYIISLPKEKQLFNPYIYTS